METHKHNPASSQGPLNIQHAWRPTSNAQRKEQKKYMGKQSVDSVRGSLLLLPPADLGVQLQPSQLRAVSPSVDTSQPLNALPLWLKKTH